MFFTPSFILACPCLFYSLSWIVSKMNPQSWCQWFLDTNDRRSINCVYFIIIMPRVTHTQHIYTNIHANTLKHFGSIVFQKIISTTTTTTTNIKRSTHCLSSSFFSFGWCYSNMVAVVMFGSHRQIQKRKKNSLILSHLKQMNEHTYRIILSMTKFQPKI